MTNATLQDGVEVIRIVPSILLACMSLCDERLRSTEHTCAGPMHSPGSPGSREDPGKYLYRGIAAMISLYLQRTSWRLQVWSLGAAGDTRQLREP